jgi:hypothetical protein
MCAGMAWPDNDGVCKDAATAYALCAWQQFGLIYPRPCVKTMWWPFQWALIYVLGGLTFVPLAVLIIIGMSCSCTLVTAVD